MGSAFTKDIVRSVRGSLGRFLAIMGIVALGCGFYAGLQMCGPDMRADADALYDGTNLWDLRLISTLGFSDDDVARVREVEGVGEVMPSLTCDAMARVGTEQVAVRVGMVDPDLAQASEDEGLYVVTSPDADYLNRARLVEGRWPEAAGECVVSADAPDVTCAVGDTIELLYGSSDLEELLSVEELVVVGSVSSSNFPYTGSFGSTTLGSGMIDQYLYVAPASLAEDAPYTEMYLTVAGARDELSESEAYQEVVDATKARLEGLEAELSGARQADLKAKAQETLDEKWDEYESEKAKAERDLADAKAELDDAAAQIASGAQELADGEASYAEGLAAYERQKGEAERKLADAEAEIAENQAKLDESRAELDTGEAELAASADKLASGEREYASGRAEYEEGLAAFEAEKAAAEKKLDAAQAELDAQRAEAEGKLAEGAAAWASQRAGLTQASGDLATCIAALQAVSDLVQAGDPTQEDLDACRTQVEAALYAARSLLDSGFIDLESADVAQRLDALLADVLSDLGDIELPENPTLEDLAGLAEQLREVAPTSLGRVMAATEEAKGQVDAGISAGDAELERQRQEATAALDAAQKEIDAARLKAEAELASARAGLDEAAGKLASARSELDEGRAQLDEGRQKLADGRAQLKEGQAQIDAARLELLAARKGARSQLEAAAAQLDDAAARLGEARAALANARAQYADGLAEYEDGRREADERFADALAQLTDAQEEVDSLEKPDIYDLDRTQSEGAATYHADAGRMDSIADVFPFIFFLVAALVSLTTMTRMVEDDRVLIGTYKALGYGTSAIAAKYLAYAGIAGTVGAVLGIALLSQVLPFIVMSAYSIIYTVPIHPFPLPIDPGIALASGGLGVGVTLLATWGAVVSSLREVPATLMLPRAPAAGKRILLERIGPVWRRLSFTWKVTCRNLFRYKRRLLMTVIGISGCTALLLVGFGLHDAIWDIIDRQYGPVIHYDTTVGLDDAAIELDVRRVTDYLVGTGEVTGIVRVQNENMQAGAAGTKETTRVNVVIPRDAAQMPTAITFRNRTSGKPLVMDDDAVLITEKLSMKYGVGVGDEILVFDQDDVGNAVGEGHALTVTGVAENYVGNLVYVGRSAWARVESRTPVFSMVYASTTADDAVRKQVTDELHTMEDVSTVIFSDETIAVYRNMLSVVDMIVVVLIVSAAALAYIVLYNLTNINIGERIREIASLKVLGFTRQEVYSYIFREIALLAVIGDALGMVLGIFLERFVVTTAEVDYVMFGRSIHPASFAYAFVLTLVFTGLVILSMRRKLDCVDMVESLKSVD